MGNPINGRTPGSPVAQVQAEETGKNTKATRQVTVNKITYNASKAKVWGLRLAREIFGLHGVIKPLYNLANNKLESLRADRAPQNTTKISERKVAINQNTLPKINRQPEEKQSSPLAYRALPPTPGAPVPETPTPEARESSGSKPAASTHLYEKIAYEDFGAEPENQDALRAELTALPKGDLNSLKYSLIKDGFEADSPALQIIEELTPETSFPSRVRTSEQKEAYKLMAELQEWSDTGLDENNYLKPRSNDNSETVNYLRERVRYIRENISHLPEHTAVRLPSRDNSPEIRIHASKFAMAAGEPDMLMMQGPKKETIGDSWHALFHNDAKVVVDLTKPDETPRKVAKYYPDTVGTEKQYESGGKTFTVALNNRENLNDNIDKCTYTVTDDNTGESKDITRLHFTKWNDHMGASTDALDNLIDETDQIAGKDGLVAVHCSAGVGRTGTFATARTAKHTLAGKELDSNQVKAEIFKLAQTGRENRNPRFIQSEGQVETLISYVSSLNTTQEPSSEEQPASETATRNNTESLYAKVDKQKQARDRAAQAAGEPIYQNLPPRNPAGSNAEPVSPVPPKRTSSNRPTPPPRAAKTVMSAVPPKPSVPPRPEAKPEKPATQQMTMEILSDEQIASADKDRKPTANRILQKAQQGNYAQKDANGQPMTGPDGQIQIDYGALAYDCLKVSRRQDGQQQLTQLLGHIEKVKSLDGEWGDAADQIENFVQSLVISGPEGQVDNIPRHRG